ncbi:hypothetical protein IFT68_23095 [Oxalobacteraceae sp. CFBP 13730]|nr:hypothetical protein [Oxalobacteraceae sp. CFBP 13730]
MAKRNVTKPLPEKIKKRLTELVSLGEFDKGDVTHCCASFCAARDGWHKILVDCYDMAQGRLNIHSRAL